MVDLYDSPLAFSWVIYFSTLAFSFLLYKMSLSDIVFVQRAHTFIIPSGIVWTIWMSLSVLTILKFILRCLVQSYKGMLLNIVFSIMLLVAFLMVSMLITDKYASFASSEVYSPW